MTTYIFDIDGTFTDISESLSDYTNAIPDENMIKMINYLYDQGNEIILRTGRGSTTNTDWSELTKKQLKEWGVKYHKLEFVNKPAKYLIIDDMAVSPREFWDIIE